MSSPLSSSAPPSPSSPFAPFSLLPFELVKEIIESAVSLNFDSSSYRDRQNTLLSFCLVSRLFHRISKPLLFAVARLTSKNVFSWMLSHEEEEDSRKLLHELIIELSWTEATAGKADLMAILYRHLQLSLLVICSSGSEVDTAKLAELEHLSVLRLGYVRVSASKPFTFPRLSELTVFYVGPTQSFSAHFNLGCFPSLRALCVHFDSSSNLSERFATRLLEVFSDQLEVIGLQGSTVSRMSLDLLRQIEHKTLVDIRSSHLAYCTRSSNIRICHGATTFFSILRDLKNLPSEVSPKLLYLPYPLLKFLNGESEYRDDLQSFLEDCVARKIEVVFEEAWNRWGVDSQFSQDFWRRMKEEKRKASTD